MPGLYGGNVSITGNVPAGNNTGLYGQTATSYLITTTGNAYSQLNGAQTLLTLLSQNGNVKFALDPTSSNTTVLAYDLIDPANFYSNTKVAAYLPTDPTIISLTANTVAQEIEISGLRANINAANAAIASNTYGNANVAAYLPTNSTIIGINANVTAANAAISALQANVGGFETYANATYATQTTTSGLQTQINTVNANIGGFETYANATYATQSTTTGLQNQITAANVNISNLQANVGGFETYANATFATQTTTSGLQTQLNTLNANVGAYETYANSTFATQTTTTGLQNQINTLNANVGAYETYANTTLSSHQTQINTLNANLGAFETYANATFGTSSYGNTQVAAYLPIYTGNIGASNVNATNLNATNLTTTGNIITNQGVFWGNGAVYGVTKIIAGGNIVVTPSGGTGDVTITAVGGSGSGGGIGYYGSFYDTTNQFANVATNSYVWNIGTTVGTNGVATQNGNAIVFSNAGVYNICYSVQFLNTDNASHNANVWIRQNGVDVPASTTQYTVPARKTASIFGALAPSITYTLSVNANDTIQFVWQQDSGNNTVYIATQAGQASNPAIPQEPGVIISATQVASTLATLNANIILTGDITGTGNTGNAVVTSLSNTGAPPGTYGSATQIPQFTVDAKGRLTGVSNVAISIPASYGNTQVAAYLPTDPTITAIQANIGGFETYANATYATQTTTSGLQTQINTLNANVGAYETYANTTLNSHQTQLNTLNANVGGFETYANATYATQTTTSGLQTQINTLNANVGAYETYANTTLSSQQGQITTLQGQVYTNSNVAAYLPTYSGSLGGTLTTGTQTGITQVGTLNGLSVSGDATISGNLTVANIYSQSTQILTVSNPLVYLASNVSYPYNYDIGEYSHFVGGPANVYAHTGIVRNHTTNYWTFFSNVKNEPTGGTINFSDPAIVYDTIYAGSAILANTTPSTSTTTGALQVAGGIGVQGNINASYIIADGSKLTNLPVQSGTYTNSNVAAYLPTYSGSLGGTLTTASQTNITSVGTLGSLAVTNAITSGQHSITYTPGTATGSAIQATGKDTQGGVGYFDFLKVTNTTTGGTNGNKTFRINSTGQLEIINSAYSAVLMALTDSGTLQLSGTATVGNITSTNGYFWANGTPYSTGGGGGSTGSITFSGTTISTSLTNGNITLSPTGTGFTISNNPTLWVGSNQDTTVKSVVFPYSFGTPTYPGISFDPLSATFSTWSGGSMSGNVYTGSGYASLYTGTIYATGGVSADSITTYTGNTVVISNARTQERTYSWGTTGGTITLNSSWGTTQTITLNSGLTLNAPTMTAGETITLIISGGVGYNNITTGTGTWKFSANGNKTLTGTSGCIDILVIFYSGSTYYASINKGFA